MNDVMVCTACGSPACWSGEAMCADWLRATGNLCTCEWGHDRDAPLIVHPDCPTHGEPS